MPYDNGLPADAKQKAAKTYNEAAEHFDAAPVAFWARYGRRTVERLNLQPGAKVLDVGCGTGASVFPAAEAVGPTGTVVGIDLAKDMIRVGQRHAVERGFDNVTFQVADMTDLDYPRDGFDAVVCVFGIFFVADMERQVADLWRLVRPGGKLAITTWGGDLFEPASTGWWQVIQRERPDLYAPAKPWTRLTDPHELRRLLAAGGATGVKIVKEDGHQQLHQPEDWWAVVLGSGLQWTLLHMDEAEIARVRAANIAWVRDNGVKRVDTGVLYAVATKPV